jgi:hypothetical protein
LKFNVSDFDAPPCSKEDRASVSNGIVKFNWKCGIQRSQKGSKEDFDAPLKSKEDFDAPLKAKSRRKPRSKWSRENFDAPLKSTEDFDALLKSKEEISLDFFGQPLPNSKEDHSSVSNGSGRLNLSDFHTPPTDCGNIPPGTVRFDFQSNFQTPPNVNGDRVSIPQGSVRFDLSDFFKALLESSVRLDLSDFQAPFKGLEIQPSLTLTP